MLTEKDRKLKWKGIEELQRTRAANVRSCVASAGSWAELARWCGMSESLLIQMAGESPVRPVSENTARRFEQALGLSAGWLDSKR